MFHPKTQHKSVLILYKSRGYTYNLTYIITQQCFNSPHSKVIMQMNFEISIRCYDQWYVAFGEKICSSGKLNNNTIQLLRFITIWGEYECIMTPFLLILQLIFNSNDLDDLITRVYAPQTFKRLVTLVIQTDQTLVSLTLLLRNNV